MGLMNSERRPSLPAEDRSGMLEFLAYSMSNPALWASLDDDIARISAQVDRDKYNIEQIVAVHLTSNFFAWRGLKNDESIINDLSTLGNLIRCMLYTIKPEKWSSAPTKTNKLSPLSDDEIRSLYQLKMFGSHFGNEKSSLERSKWLKGIAIAQAFGNLGAVLEQREASIRDRASASSDWLQRVGGSDSAMHLLKDGWLPFLKSLEHPDIRLWNEIVTDFEEFEGDRLEAAFWILEQPECDRLTAWHFIVGTISWEVLDWDPKMQKERRETTLQDAFEAVLKRWNTGFYRYHSLSYPQKEEDEVHHGFDGSTIFDLLTALEHRLDLPPFTRPSQLDQDLGNPTDDLSRSVSVGLRYCHQEGLCLQRGCDWHVPAWHPASAVEN